MMFLHKLTDSLRKQFQAKASEPRSSTPLRLEPLEDRVVPATTLINTYTNATVQISPGLTVTETVTASVTNFQGFDTSTGQFTAIPTGVPTPTKGTVLFNLNNQMQSATLNANGQATATFQVPLLTFLTSQTLEVQYLGFTDTTTGNSWQTSTFLAPLYKNFDNVLLAGTLTFNQLTPQQVYAESIFIFQNPSSPLGTLTPYNTAQGEADTITGPLGPLTFNYIDPGTINSITAFGTQFPGVLALQLGAFSGFPATSSSR